MHINIIHNYILPHFIYFNKQILLFIAAEDDIQKQPFADRITPVLDQLY